MTDPPLGTLLTMKQHKVIELWAAEYHKLGSDPNAAPNLSEESRRYKLLFADALTAALTELDAQRAKVARLEALWEAVGQHIDAAAIGYNHPQILAVFTDNRDLRQRVAALEREQADTRRQAFDEALEIVDTEPELPGPIPDGVRHAIFDDPVGTLRSTVRATKHSISSRIESVRAKEMGSAEDRGEKFATQSVAPAAPAPLP